MLLNFPCMHPELVAGELPENVSFLDPGYAAEPVDGAYRPESLPLAPTMAQNLINDCISFGSQFKDPKEMAFFGAYTPEDYFSESAGTLKSELINRISGSVANQKDDEAESVAKSQFLLLLAWFFEERQVESMALEKGVNSAWSQFGEALGEDIDELELPELGSEKIDSGSIGLPWQRVMEAVPAMIPEGQILVCVDPVPVEFWQDRGFEFTAAAPEMGLPEGAKVCTAPAWQLAGHRKPLKEMPTASRNVTVAVLA